ncbi:Poly-beta-hydroxybutyrate polymerase N terminal [Roseovarius lutimaris]|uniref:Poly-beta-hydroxybutyrate polymerase N terminal n=1 Tax=Roseovarius lutimaris TaxID=1005928 RepID=A0A1I5F6T4_9RHOB|nr:Poly-beta-hydroxybutyrate polymerase N terminal [Roseovarius lutimaris]
MTDMTIETALSEELHRIAPDIGLEDIDRTQDLREKFDIDSMDFLTLVTALAYATGGVSPYSVSQARNDWALHLGRSPGRQLELAERAQANALKVTSCAASALTGQTTVEPFTARAHDHRFAHAAWANPPFNLWKQGFLAVQDWWEHATDTMRGLDPQDAERTRFQLRQMLDLMSPSNFA